MPRYFFDFDDGETYISDQVGIDLPDIDTVDQEAMETLHDIVHARMPFGRHRFVVRVRDAMNVCVYCGEMAIKGERF